MECGKLLEATRNDALGLAVQAAGVGVWEIDVASDTVRGTPQFFRIMGLPPTDAAVPMETLRALRIGGDRERVNHGYLAAIATGIDQYESEYRIRRPDGAERWILGRGRVIRDLDGKPVRFSGADLDVTDRKLTEHALAQSEARLRIAVEAADLGIWDWDLARNAMTWSDRAKAIAGLPAALPVSFEQIRDITHPDDLPRTSEMAARALDPAIRSKEAYEYRIVRPDGSVRWVVAHGEAVFADQGDGPKAIRYIGTLQDVTERRAIETDLRESESRLRLAVDAARLSIWEYDVASASIRSTPELNRMLGFPEDQPLEVDAVNARYYPGDAQRLQEAAAAALAEGQRYFQLEYRYLWADGSIRWLLLRAEILFDANNNPSGALGVVMDISEEKEVEEHRTLLLSELQHRVSNTLALVSAIANQTFRGDVHDEPLGIFSKRLSALGDAHRILISQNWRSAEMTEVVTAALKPYWLPERFEVGGPKLALGSRQALALALAVNELATNAAKYGALSNDEGRVAVTWRIEPQADGPHLHFRWQESGGPPVSEPTGSGFGTRLIKMLAADFNGELEVRYSPAGVACTLIAPLGAA
ncbi:MAG: PAS domain-containing protein [Bauldia sp.]